MGLGLLIALAVLVTACSTTVDEFSIPTPFGPIQAKNLRITSVTKPTDEFTTFCEEPVWSEPVEYPAGSGNSYRLLDLYCSGNYHHAYDEEEDEWYRLDPPLPYETKGFGSVGELVIDFGPGFEPGLDCAAIFNDIPAQTWLSALELDAPGSLTSFYLLDFEFDTVTGETMVVYPWSTALYIPPDPTSFGLLHNTCIQPFDNGTQVSAIAEGIKGNVVDVLHYLLALTQNGEFSAEAPDPNSGMTWTIEASVITEMAVISREGVVMIEIPLSESPYLPCQWDLDNDDNVGITDFLSLLGQWGTSPGGAPDFNGNLVVDINDFLALLAHWGSCP